MKIKMLTTQDPKIKSWGRMLCVTIAVKEATVEVTVRLNR